jgi:eukaryotic-like serine/threonine-protein kinase
LELDPTWSPDGNILAFGHNDSIRPDQSFIETFNLKTHQISQFPGSQGIFAPRWSPDGRYIVALSTDGNRLMICDVKSEKWRQLSSIPQSVGYIAWSKDSTYIYFDTLPTHENGYFRLRISDNKMEKVVDLKKVRLFPAQFGTAPWTGLGPGETPLFPRDVSTQEIYALDLRLP